jgi:hypothetical protein
MLRHSQEGDVFDDTDTALASARTLQPQNLDASSPLKGILKGPNQFHEAAGTSLSEVSTEQ